MRPLHEGAAAVKPQDLDEVVDEACAVLGPEDSDVVRAWWGAVLAAQARAQGASQAEVNATFRAVAAPETLSVDSLKWPRVRWVLRWVGRWRR